MKNKTRINSRKEELLALGPGIKLRFLNRIKRGYCSLTSLYRTLDDDPELGLAFSLLELNHNRDERCKLVRDYVFEGITLSSHYKRNFYQLNN